ncbi:MAG: GGDEF domain-containing protein, partial [Solirubrobacterales bacterium]|nr:GGDEF domain-containing protein [Solirubrobacterales bacterium]
RRLRHQALHDSLTDLPNRLLLYERMEDAIRAAGRSGGMAALLLIDLDRFKEVNDTLGHDHGDRLLIEVAQRLRDTMRRSDTLARLGATSSRCFWRVSPTGLPRSSSPAASRRRSRGRSRSTAWSRSWTPASASPSAPTTATT